MREQALDGGGAEDRGGRGRRGGRRSSSGSPAHNFTFLGYRGTTATGPGLGILRDSRGGGPDGRRSRRDSSTITLSKANTRSTVHRAAYLDFVGVSATRDVSTLPRPLHAHGLPRQPDRDPDPAPPGGRACSSAPASRTAATTRRRCSRSSTPTRATSCSRSRTTSCSTWRWGSSTSASASGCACSRAATRSGASSRCSCSCRATASTRRTGAASRRSSGPPPARRRSTTRRACPSPCSCGCTSWPTWSRAWSRTSTPREVEMMLVAATRSWADDLEEALDRGARRGAAAASSSSATRDAFPAAYRADWVARSALADIVHVEELPEADGLGISLYRPLEAGPRMLRAKLFRAGRPLMLSDVLPLFENMGVRGRRRAPVPDRPARPRRRLDLRLRPHLLRAAATSTPAGSARASRTRSCAPGAARSRTTPTTGSCWAAALTWREITVLRAIGKYLRQARITFSDRYVEQALVAQPGDRAAARGAVPGALRPAPHRPRGRRGDRRADRRGDRRGREPRPGPDPPHVPRGDPGDPAHELLPDGPDGGGRATCRSSSTRRRSAGCRSRARGSRSSSTRPRTEGVHLRGGAVARGGIRWSDRREDFRTEVLGLMKAQMVKNAVIVPVGAKGGFVVKRPPARRDDLPEEVVACYQTFIRGLLDLTDNIAGRRGRAAPADVVRYDGDDPYLVVAADKGTATFSDIANGIAIEEGFWLGDAFASGGSTGYDHKKMGITARGAWESVKRHFRELGKDIQTRGLHGRRHRRHVGRRVRQRHAALAPHPAGRRVQPPARLHRPRPRSRAELRGAGAAVRAAAARRWDDYDRDAISAGGGVYERTAKSIPVSPRGARGARDRGRVAEAQRADPGAPPRARGAALERRHRHLREGAVREPRRRRRQGERRACASNGSELRAKVVGEGGNLGVTQRGRIEFALAGGSVNTDAIDNSGGVDCSDREVNIKILLDAVVEAGDLTEKQRNELLVEMTDEVAALVLQDNYEQSETLSLAEANAASMVDVHQRFLRFLESRRNLRPRARGAAGRRGDRRAQARPRRAHAPGARRAAGVQQDRPEGGDPRLGRARGPVPVRRARALLPRPAARALRRRRCASTGWAARSWPPRW